MSFDRAKSALAGTRFANLRSVAETGSTNADMRRLLLGEASIGVGSNEHLDPPESPVVLLADHQSAGRGRLDRSWQAPAGTSILMTIGLPVALIPVERRTLLTMCISLAVTDATTSMEIHDVSIKWPNDIVCVDNDTSDGMPASALGYHKIGGVLAEMMVSPNLGDCVLLGLGLNVNWTEIPQELTGTATSLRSLAGRTIDRDDLLVAMLASFDTKWLPLVTSTANGVACVVDEYRRRCSTIGRRVRVELPDGSTEGVVEDISDTGALILRTSAGSQLVTAGDVVHVRRST